MPKKMVPGVGTYRLNVAQYTVGAGHVLEIEEGDPKVCKSVYQLLVNGTEQKISSPCEAELFATPHWVEDKLVLDLRPAAQQPSPRQVSLYLQEDRVICELQAANGNITVKRIFKRSTLVLQRASSFAPASLRQTKILEKASTAPLLVSEDAVAAIGPVLGAETTAAITDLESAFIAASETVKKIQYKPSQEELLKLYALFKQSTVGGVVGARPGMMDMKARYKWDTWKSLGDMDKATAQQQYCSLVDKLAPGWRLSKPEAAPISSCPSKLHRLASQRKRVDFSGEWMCVAVEGDFEGCQGDAHWLRRSLSGLTQSPQVALGVGNHRQHIAQYTVRSGDVIEVEDCLSSGKMLKSILRIDGQEQDFTDASGVEMGVIPSWDGETLVMVFRNFVPGRRAPPPSKRFLRGNDMCLEVVADSGATCLKIFQRI